MNQKRILNALLVIVAVLLLVNLGVTIFPSAHAIPKTQYRVISMAGSYNSTLIEAKLNQQSTEGWTYIGDLGQGDLIFKK